MGDMGAGMGGLAGIAPVGDAFPAALGVGVFCGAVCAGGLGAAVRMNGGLGLLPGDDDALLLRHSLREHSGIGLNIAAGMLGRMNGVVPTAHICVAGRMGGAVCAGAAV